MKATGIVKIDAARWAPLATALEQTHLKGRALSAALETALPKAFGSLEVLGLGTLAESEGQKVLVVRDRRFEAEVAGASALSRPYGEEVPFVLFDDVYQDDVWARENREPEL